MLSARRGKGSVPPGAMPPSDNTCIIRRCHYEDESSLRPQGIYITVGFRSLVDSYVNLPFYVGEHLSASMSHRSRPPRRRVAQGKEGKLLACLAGLRSLSLPQPATRARHAFNTPQPAIPRVRGGFHWPVDIAPSRNRTSPLAGPTLSLPQ